jgi:phosphate transport system substrate-binding protein
MALRRGLRALTYAAIGMMAVSTPAFAATLKVGGTGAVTEFLGQLASSFRDDTGIVLEVVPGLGTSGANNAVADGKLGLAFSGRPLRATEAAKGLKHAATFHTVFGLVTSRQGAENLKRSEIAALFRSDSPVWPDGGPILIVLRPVDESDNLLLENFFPGMAEALIHLRQRSDLSIAATDQDNADMAERIKGSLTGASLAQIISEKRNLRFASIDGVAATLENYQNGSYPYGKSLYVIVPSVVSREAEAFIAFLARPAAEAQLRQAGIIAGK